ncbi:MAG: sigma factor, partial [Ktedonobacteraceae bacterium]
MESILQASSTLGAVGSLAQPSAQRTRRGRSAGTATGSQGMASSGRSIRSQTTVGVRGTDSPSRVYARGAIVEAMSDVALVELVLADDQEAFAVLVERYKDAVQNLAYRMLSNATEAEDVTQETFVRAFTQLATYKPAHK